MIDEKRQVEQEVISALGEESRWPLAFHEHLIRSFLSIHQLSLTRDVSFHVKDPEQSNILVSSLFRS